MNNPIIADNKPVKVNFSKDQEYYFCTCGKSSKQPFCDGSHIGTSFSPKAVSSSKDEEVYLCACKHTNNAPFCDGTHKKFTTQDILFGPKLSMMVVGKDALSSDKAIRKLVRRAATDSSVFDQFACASPHTIFVEKGGKISPKEFARLLATAMEKALTRLPTKAPDKGQANKIRSKIAEYGFIGDAWVDKYLRWTVLYSEDSELVAPTYQRTITVKGVNDIYDVIASVDDDIQTIGLALSGNRRLDFATAAMQKGAVRCPDIGFMTHFDSPWDGMFMLDRLVRWVSLGGPL